MKNTKAELKRYSSQAHRHGNILQKALSELPNHHYTVHDLEKDSFEDTILLDAISSRFTKLQDTIGGKLFPLILEELQENKAQMPFIDKINLLEKLGYIESAEQWKTLRMLRNDIAHEYADEQKEIVLRINQLIEQAHKLLIIWQDLSKKIAALSS